MSVPRCRLLFITVLMLVLGARVFLPEIMAASDVVLTGYQSLAKDSCDLINDRYICADWWYAQKKMGPDRSNHIFIGEMFMTVFASVAVWLGSLLLSKIPTGPFTGSVTV